MSLRNMARSIKRKALRYKQGGRPNICVLGIRRGGSTLLADMIAEQRGVWYANEPFAVFKKHQNAGADLSRWLPQLRHSQFFGLSPEQQERTDRYIELLQRGAVPIGTSRLPLSMLTADRVCIKVLNAPFLADRFADPHGMETVFLTRHPAAQARSIIRQGWGYSAEAYFEQPGFLADYLTAEQLELGQRILAADSSEATDWDKAILNWWIENLYPLRHAKTLTHVITYEELTLKPEPWIDTLCDSLQLDDPKTMLAVANRPSNSSRMSTGDTMKQIAGSDRQGLITSWQSRVSPDLVSRAQTILDAFGVTEYRMDDPMPADRLLRFA